MTDQDQDRDEESGKPCAETVAEPCVYTRQYNIMKVVLCILFVNYIINGLLMLWLGFFHSDFIKYGPSHTLVVPFTHVVIDTWGKYVAVCAAIIYNDVILVVCADLVSPWISSHVLNGVVPTLNTPKVQTYFMVQLYFITTAFSSIAFIGVSMTQIDLYFVNGMGPLIAGFISSWYILKNKK